EARNRIASAPSSRFACEDPADILEGDICVAVEDTRHPDLARIVVVLEADDTSPYVTVALATEELELATATDLVLYPEATALRYRIAIFGRISGPVFRSQLVRRIGAIRAEPLEAVMDL